MSQLLLYLIFIYTMLSFGFMAIYSNSMRMPIVVYRLIPTGRKTRKSHNRSFQIPSSRIDTRKMSFFPRTVRDWNLLAPDIVELDTPEDFKAMIVSL